MRKSRKPAPTTETGSHKTTSAHDSSLYRAEDGYAAPTAQDRREAKLLAELRELGYRISVNCTVCGHPLVREQSVASHLGPVCAAKVGAK